MPKKDITGQRFGKLVAKKYLRSDNGRAVWLCVCDCGNSREAYGTDLNAGRVKTCGRCSKKTDPYNRERIYWVWHSMKNRCNNKGEKSYLRYGGRGISICDEWKNSFTAFREWAYANGYDENAARGECTLDRIDPDGNYCPENCRWVDLKVQANNHSPDCPKRAKERLLNRALVHIHGNKDHCVYKYTMPEEYK